MRHVPSAEKHEINPTDAYYAAQWPLWVEPLDEETPYRELRLGFDPHGRLLEIVVVIDSVNEDEILIHAMKARKKYLYLLDQ